MEAIGKEPIRAGDKIIGWVAAGGYGYLGWIWETVEGIFQIKQGPELLSTETSLAC